MKKIVKISLVVMFCIIATTANAQELKMNRVIEVTANFPTADTVRIISKAVKKMFKNKDSNFVPFKAYDYEYITTKYFSEDSVIKQAFTEKEFIFLIRHFVQNKLPVMCDGEEFFPVVNKKGKLVFIAIEYLPANAVAPVGYYDYGSEPPHMTYYVLTFKEMKKRGGAWGMITKNPF